ncbi:hypothetical protein PanWU01x14_009700 [Parasponia andersonii]|uniref:Uncharacterized protein n=1 Tax=Parasponia andersonii TaxID=3476 RepID=A0A2P5E2H5_PARAD|nr:hypothetical protein PanWU01x14_009700 [Parasponia andersonii]
MMPFESCHGSRSILSHLKEGENPETHDLPSLVDNFKDMHRHLSTGWTN